VAPRKPRLVPSRAQEYLRSGVHAGVTGVECRRSMPRGVRRPDMGEGCGRVSNQSPPSPPPSSQSCSVPKSFALPSCDEMVRDRELRDCT